MKVNEYDEMRVSLIKSRIFINIGKSLTDENNDGSSYFVQEVYLQILCMSNPYVQKQPPEVLNEKRYS